MSDLKNMIMALPPSERLDLATFILQSLSKGQMDMELTKFREKFAVNLFEQDRITLGQAAKIADMSQVEFQRLLGMYQIPIHGGEAQLSKDLDRLNQFFS